MHHISILIDVYMYKTAEAYGSITTATHLELCDQTALVRTCTCKQHWSAAHDVLTTLIVFYHIGLFGLVLAFRVMASCLNLHACMCVHVHIYVSMCSTENSKEVQYIQDARSRGDYASNEIGEEIPYCPRLVFMER
jgi:hypothetical protein